MIRPRFVIAVSAILATHAFGQAASARLAPTQRPAAAATATTASVAILRVVDPLSVRGGARPKSLVIDRLSPDRVRVVWRFQTSETEEPDL